MIYHNNTGSLEKYANEIVSMRQKSWKKSKRKQSREKLWKKRNAEFWSERFFELFECCKMCRNSSNLKIRVSSFENSSMFGMFMTRGDWEKDFHVLLLSFFSFFFVFFFVVIVVIIIRHYGTEHFYRWKKTENQAEQQQQKASNYWFSSVIPSWLHSLPAVCSNFT